MVRGRRHPMAEALQAPGQMTLDAIAQGGLGCVELSNFRLGNHGNP